MLKKSFLIVLFAISMSGTSIAQSSVAVPVIKSLMCRDKLVVVENKLGQATDNYTECMNRAMERSEELALCRIALANADNSRLRIEGQLAGVRENVDELIKENKNLRQKNKDHEFTLARYSYSFAGMTIPQIAIAIGLFYLIVRLWRRKT